MKRAILLYFSLVLGIMAANAQRFEWANAIENVSDASVTDSYISVSDIAVDDTGNFYITGCIKGSFDFNPGAGTALLSVDTLRFPFIAKFTNEGQYVWAIKLESEGDSKGNAIALDDNGNIYITGQSNISTDFDPGPALEDINSFNSIFLAKYDNGGNYIWANMLKERGLVRVDNSNAIAVDASGNVYIAGDFNSQAIDFDLDNTTDADTIGRLGGSETFIAKYNTNGEYIYAKSLQGYGSESITDIMVDASQNVFFTGTFNPTSIDVDPDISNEVLLANQGASDIFIGKLNSTGDYVWAHAIGGSSNDYVFDMEFDGSGNLVIAGKKTGVVDLNPGTGVAELESSKNWFVAKYSTSGSYISAMGLAGDASLDNKLSITIDPDENMYLSAWSDVAVELDPNSDNSNFNSAGSFFAKYNPDGNFEWAKRLSYSSAEVLTSLDVSNNLTCIGTGVGANDFNYGFGVSEIASDNRVAFFANYSNCISLNSVSQPIICGNEVLVVGNHTYDSSGVYFDTLNSYFGCDSSVINYLTVNPAYLFEDTVYICEGDSVIIYGAYQKANGNYFDNYTTILDCDSIYKTTLVVQSPQETNEMISICNGDPVFLQGAWRNTSGTYYDTLSTIHGCDSIIITELSVGVGYVSSSEKTICDGESVSFGSKNVTQAGTHYDTLTSSFGCDSVLVLDLTVLPAPVVELGDETVEACDGDEFVFDVYNADFVSYLWNDLSSDSIRTIVYDGANPLSGLSVEVTGSNGCTSVDRVAFINKYIGDLSQKEPNIIEDPYVSFTVENIPENADGWYWSFGDGDTVQGEPENLVYLYRYYENTTFEACLNAYNSCGTTSDCYNVTITDASGVKPVTLKKNNISEFSVFPNPSNGKIYIEIENYVAVEFIEVRVINIVGETVHTAKYIGGKTGFSTELNLGDNAPGIYLISILINNEQSAQKQIIIQ